MEGEARRRPPIIYPSLSPSARRELRRRRRRTIRSTVSVHPSPSTLVCVRFRLSPSCSVTQSNVSCPSLSVCDHPIPSDPSPHPRPSTTCLTCYSSLTPSTSSLPQPSQPLSLDLCLLFPSFPSTHRVRHHYSSSSAVLIHLVSHHHLDIFLSLTSTAPHREASPLSLIPSHSLQNSLLSLLFSSSLSSQSSYTLSPYNFISPLKQNNYLIISRIALNIQSF
jgi:hypothetical protein